MAKDRESHSKILSKDSSNSDSDSGRDDRNPLLSKKNKSKDKSQLRFPTIKYPRFNRHYLTTQTQSYTRSERM